MQQMIELLDMESNGKAGTKGQASAKPTRQAMMEKEWNEMYLKPFDATHSASWAYLTHRFGKRLCHGELKSIAFLASKHNNISFPREYYRKKKGIILWFEINYEVVVDWMENKLKAYDKHGNEIGILSDVLKD